MTSARIVCASLTTTQNALPLVCYVITTQYNFQVMSP
jgi:hypothetical protein